MRKTAELIFHDNKIITSVFQMLGYQENDITMSIGWLLKQCPPILLNLISEFCKIQGDSEKISIQYQNFEKVNGKYTYTDLEITDYQNFHIIFEAKRGWILPSSEQLTLYSEKPSFTNTDIPCKLICTISECSSEYAERNLPFHQTPNGINVTHLSWEKLKELCIATKSQLNHREKNLLLEFLKYLEGVSTMRKLDSNSVYVVSLSSREAGNGYSCIDVVKKSNHYYCPVSWFKNENHIPNYLAFRYYGKLQSIHHVDSYIVTKNMHDKLDFMPDEEWGGDHYIFNLGPAIYPPKEIKCGDKIHRSTRVYADIDLLLTSDTITEAMQKTKLRRGE